ncbi:MAG: hypothetical protein IIT45_07940, partial [Treponema sp.]|nr:hypothetical protein [Treponema sp.]
MRVFAENAIVKNGKEAIFYGLSGVPLSLHSCGTAAPPLQSRVGHLKKSLRSWRLKGVLCEYDELLYDLEKKIEQIENFTI